MADGKGRSIMASMNFNTENNTFRKLLGNGLTYLIPRFQRDYSWTSDEWDDLWQDIVALFETDPEPAHYMGYLVLQSQDNKVFDIIDGQQRLTTLSVLILAALSHLRICGCRTGYRQEPPTDYAATEQLHRISRPGDSGSAFEAAIESAQQRLLPELPGSAGAYSTTRAAARPNTSCASLRLVQDCHQVAMRPGRHNGGPIC